MFRKIILSFFLSLILAMPAFATISSTNSRMDYTGNGAVDTYSYSYRIFSNTDLLVTVRDTDDVETTLTLTTDYTVTGVGSSSGTVVLVNSGQAWLDADGDLKSNYILTIRRVRPLTQSTDIRNQGEFFPETHEDAFDHFVMIDQQQQDEIDRSMKLPETIDPDDFDTNLPVDLAGNPGASIIVNDDGDGFTDGPTADEISGAQASATAAAASASAASTSATSAANSATTAAAAVAGAINFWGGTVGGTGDAITLTPSPALSAYSAGVTFTFLSTGTNTGAASVAISGLTARPIKTQADADLTAGEITTGRIYTLTYTGTVFSVHQIAPPEDGSVTNAKVNASAAIAYSKLNLTGAIVNGDLAGSIADSKLSQITTASKVSGAAITAINSVPSGAGALPTKNGGTGSDFSATAQGSVVYFNGAGTTAALAPGTVGYVLKSGGTGANPTYGAVLTDTSCSTHALSNGESYDIPAGCYLRGVNRGSGGEIDSVHYCCP